MERRQGARRPGVVPVPNGFFDQLLPTLCDTELRVLLVVLRGTLGYREPDGQGGWRPKQRDWISHGQLLRRTGRGSEAISRAIAGLVGRGLLIVEDDKGSPLLTPEARRRHVGRLYFRPVDMWKTDAPRYPAQPKTTTYRKYNNKGDYTVTCSPAWLQRDRVRSWPRTTVSPEQELG